MKRLMIVFVVLSLLLGSASFGFGGRSSEKQSSSTSTTQDTKKTIPTAKITAGGSYLISNFEFGSLKSPQEWWVFDIKKAEPIANTDYSAGDRKVAAEVGNYSLAFNGTATNWYAGGCGTYIAKENQDLSIYDTFKIDVYGNGLGSGTLKIELLDDDNNNWQAEQDSNNSYAPVYDDKLVYDISVDWSGWKRLEIPLADFVDANDGVGDDIWNPQQTNGSGGLLELQFICLGSKADGAIKFNVDNIYLSVEE
ncbi:hypothetical protein A2291_03720 [candidate division WOR-1 bacterium RIFOXYB2_FULL_42_35]|uniref:CBM11 domain-containing protein n=1 Tax=candidate division WOR-1 bacterium RIFOXYC2_FULL_41_25 TaxID=1802586 RepID=A0A1F4TSF8_UNCSA|nr:MAG: hypothetical protein A2247_03290 [candidate division WOR-1 bacterium RIFOXYA2_FULL_41_14]OGC25571.1 MAG: hypothetical protein A2291_03720 [candidate division WOR-1 bacterium RIFOXYB2_FULL_42_35]OGC35003.1 MAG: hypothetical protein A2462_05350 [candidate division WOR-1 bacterium RIFOXYC2_FULL_41_25]OGC42628.1 MAG: hypothetical protein A2548_03220 [candidate division WOR-1 bacterium RIFOXYD2_FULL_41_8]